MRDLTEDQREASDIADNRGQSFANVAPDMLFGKFANGVLAQEVYRVNPRVYRQKRAEYELEAGHTPRPMEYWHRLPNR